MIKRVFIGLLALALLGALSIYAVGGKLEAMLLFVKYGMRQEHAPTREIAWIQGPDQPVAADRKKKPNVILIVADDLGYNDITLNGGGVAHGAVPTPNINRLAQEGVNFQTSYSGNATCAPSRAAIMTGRYPTRFGFEFTPTPKLFMKMIGQYKPAGDIRFPIYHPDRESDVIPYEDMGLPVSEVSLAKLMKGAGYRTLHIGKWHLGDSPQFRSYAHGFDEALSFMHGSSMYLPENDPNVVNARQDYDMIDRFQWAAHSWGIRFNDGKVFKPKNYVTDYLTDEAVKAIAANKNQPFFMYLAYTAPHTPLQATKEDYAALPQIKDHTERVYGAMILSLDRNVGRVLQTLKEQGLDDDTLVIFTSDNGGAHYIGVEGLNSPFRGWKGTFFEGGIRVPLFMRWPTRLPKGATLSEPVSHMDIFATTANAVGAKAPTDRIIDGVDLLPFIEKKASGRPHETLFWRTDSYRVVRHFDWKLQVTEIPKKDWLYDLGVDPTEQKNLALMDPQRVKTLTSKIVDFNKTQVKPLWPSLAEAPIPVDKMMKQPQRPDDEFIYYAN